MTHTKRIRSESSLSNDLKRLSSPLKPLTKKQKAEIDALADEFSAMVTVEEILENHNLTVTIEKKKGRKTTKKEMDLTDMFQGLTMGVRKIARATRTTRDKVEPVRRSTRGVKKLPSVDLKGLRLGTKMMEFLQQLQLFTKYLFDHREILEYLDDIFSKMVEARNEKDVNKLKLLKSKILDIHLDVQKYIVQEIDTIREVMMNTDRFVEKMEQFIESRKDASPTETRKKNIETTRILARIYSSEFKELQKVAESIVKKLETLQKPSVTQNETMENELADILKMMHV